MGTVIFDFGSTLLPRVAVNLYRGTWRGCNVKQCSSIADIESEMEQRSGGSHQPELGTLLSEFTASKFHGAPLAGIALVESFPPCLPPSPSSRSFILSYPLHTVFQREEFPRGDSLKRKTEPWRCTLAFRSCDDVFHRRLDKRKGTLVRGDQPRENWRERRVTSRIGRTEGVRTTLEGSRGILACRVSLFKKKRERERSVRLEIYTDDI